MSGKVKEEKEQVRWRRNPGHIEGPILSTGALSLSLAQPAERDAGASNNTSFPVAAGQEEGNKSGGDPGDTETLTSSSAELWGNQRD